jgi:hypothetical protein
MPVRLPVRISRAASGIIGGHILLIGGMLPNGSTTDAIYAVSPAGGSPVLGGRLAQPVHDEAAAPLGGAILVVGGGAQRQEAAVQVVDGSLSSRLVGSLPQPRADLSAVGVPAGVVVLAGGASGMPDPTVLLTHDGRVFTRLARLPVGVRYAAAAALGNYVYVFGGETATGETGAIQRIDPGGRRATTVGSMPAALSHASAFVIDGRLLVVGGRRAGVAQTAIWEFDVAKAIVRRIGRLPYAVSDAASSVLDNVGYLLGGEGSIRLSTMIAVSFP